MGKVKGFIAWVICFFFVEGICMNISPNGPLAVIALVIMFAIPLVLLFTKKDAFDKNKKEFSSQVAGQVKKLPAFGQDNTIAVVLDMGDSPEVRAIQLRSKVLYHEENRLWARTYLEGEGILLRQKFDQAYRLNTRYGRQDEKEKALNNLNKIVRYCAAELGPDYVGFVHFSYAPGVSGVSATLNVSYEGGGIDRVTVTEGGSYFGALGIVCHKEYYEAYKPHICAKNDGHIYYTRRQKYFKKESQHQAKW